MAPRRIQCIFRLPNHQDRHRRVDAIGGIDGGHWKDSEREAIANIRSDPDSYYVTEEGKSVAVVVRLQDGREYLKTKTDHFLPEDLLGLPDCSRGQ